MLLAAPFLIRIIFRHNEPKRCRQNGIVNPDGIGVGSGSTLFAYTCLSENLLGSLQLGTWARQKGINSQSPRNSLLTVQGGNFSEFFKNYSLNLGNRK